MAAPDWETIKQIFSEALSVPAAARDAYVARACDGRGDIQQAVTELLRAHTDASQTFLEPDSVVVRPAWLFPPGERVAGRFRVVKPIARGAMGEVYQVYDERLRLPVALKAIRPELLADAESVERFRREVLVTREIAHDGLCRVFDLIEHPLPAGAGFPDGTVVPCLTMQLLEGTNLDEWLTAHRPMPVAEAMPLVRQIVEALQVLHDAGVVHRDLKPSNVMLVSAGARMRAVLTDFGLAKPLDEGLFETQRTVHGGAPFFMSPELFRGERPSRASDIYALGLLVDEMVTTSRAFSADSLPSLLLQKLGEGPEPVSRRSSGVPTHWQRVIRRCVAADPRDRFASADAVLAALEEREHRLPWRSASRWPVASYLPHRWGLAGYSALGAVVLTAMASLGSPMTPPAPLSVAIGRFANLTNNRDLEYLATGTAGELGRRLSSVKDLRVYNGADPGSPVDPSKRAALSLSGHIQQLDTTLRVTVQITDTANGALLWSQNVDGSARRFLELEDELAAETVGALVRLQPVRRGPITAALSLFGATSRPSLPRSGTTNSAALDAYFRGRALFEERSLPSSLQAIAFLKRAVQQDPNYAAAYATLADVQGVLMDLHYAPHSQLLAEAELYAGQAVALDPELADAQLSLASVRQMQWRWDDADAAYRRALELHPTSARAHRWYGGLLLQFGKFAESLEQHRRAIDLDPYDYPNQSAYGHALFNAGRVQEAAAHLERVVAQKDLLYAHALLGQAYACLSRNRASGGSEYGQKAMQQSAKLRQMETPIEIPSTGVVVSQYADLVAALASSYQGDAASAAQFVERLEAGRAHGRISPGTLARIYAVQKDVTRTMEALREAEMQRDRELYYINVSPYYADVRAEPQFRALVERLHLTR